VQETARRPPFGSMLAGADQDEPFQVIAFGPPTATQGETPGQETERRWPPGSIVTDVDHVEPFQVNAFP
jgi:hypothetical protein